MNLLDTFVWPYLEAIVLEEKPSTIEEMQEIVENSAKAIPKDMMLRELRATDNFYKRVLACSAEDGGHFGNKMS